MYRFLLIILALQLFHSHSGLAQKNRKPEKNSEQNVKKFTTYDLVYEPAIKTVTLFPHTGNKSDYLQPALTPLDQTNPMLLSFDEIKPDADNYYVKIIHCNADWTPSTLSEIQYLYDYNEFFITDRRTSINTKIPYVHYSIFLPKVKISGNYVVKVYRNYNEDDLILTKRFMVFENAINIIPEIKFARQVSERDKSQQVDFTITYPNYNLINPAMTLKVVIRQNNRWDKAIYNIPPLFVKENLQTLEYNYFNGENAFKGGNEFNAFDISSLITYKLNISKIVEKPEYYEVILLQDKPKANQPYVLVPDIDGKYFIDQYDFGDSEVSSDYAYVNFVLNAPPQPGKIFVTGGMNDWRLDEEFMMTYNTEINRYVCRTLLKQGYYNYEYTLVNEQFPNGNELYFSGSHSQTQNNYEIFAYYRPPGERADYLIGYKAVNFMAQR